MAAVYKMNIRNLIVLSLIYILILYNNTTRKLSLQ